MALPIWQGLAAYEAAGNIATLQSPSVHVMDLETGLDASLFSDRNGTTPLTNPFVGDGVGRIAFYVPIGRYLITASKDGNSITWDDVQIGTPPMQTTAPIVEPTSVTFNEYESTTVIITNYDPELEYTVEDDVYTVTARSGNTLTISSNEVPADTNQTVKINTKTNGIPVSEWTEIEVSLVNIVLLEDTAIQVVDFTGEADTNDGWSLV